MKKIDRTENIIRIVFAGLFLVAGIAVQLILSGPYTLVSVVLYINGILCAVSGIMNLVKLKRAVAAENVSVADRDEETQTV